VAPVSMLEEMKERMRRRNRYVHLTWEKLKINRRGYKKFKLKLKTLCHKDG
jgi:hypothetical protein